MFSLNAVPGFLSELHLLTSGNHAPRPLSAATSKITVV